MQKYDVSAASVIGRAWRQMRQNVIGNLLRRPSRIIPPVIGIDLVADRRVAQVLCHFQRTHFIFRVRFGVNRVRRTKQDCP